MVHDIIRIEQVHREFRMGSETVRALKGVSLSVASGEFVTIMGASGSGKSTLLNILGCLDWPTKGDYFLDGIPVASMNREALAKMRNRKIGFIFQAYNLFCRFGLLLCLACCAILGCIGVAILLIVADALLAQLGTSVLQLFHSEGCGHALHWACDDAVHTQAHAIA